MLFYLVGAMEHANIPWLYTVEQGKNRDRSDAYDLFFFSIFRHDFF